VLINSLIRIDSGPKILRSCFLHWLAGLGAVVIGADKVWLSFFPFLVLKTVSVGYRHFECALGEDGGEAGVLQPIAPDLFFAEEGKQKSAFRITEEIGTKELRSHVVVVDSFLVGGISHEDAKDVVAVNALQWAEFVW